MSRPDGAREVDEFLDHLRAERGLSAATVSAYRRDLGRYVAFLAGRDVVAPTRAVAADVLAFPGWLRERAALDGRALRASTVARAIVAVRGLHRFLAVEGRAPSELATVLETPRVARPLPRALPVEVVARLVTAPTGADPAALRDRAALELLYGAGLRVSELTGLDVDDLDRVDRLVRVRGKGDRERVVPYGEPADDALEAWLRRGRPSLAPRVPAVFLNLRGGRLTRQGAWGILRSHAERLGIDGVTPHALRHSFATHLLDGGADVREVQELLGHASVTTTQVYTLVSRTALRSVYERAHPRAARR
jgi:integrase/recombinase XerD